MKKMRTKENIRLVAVKNNRNYDRKMDYYLVDSKNHRMYAFTRSYTNSTYNLCKSGIRVNQLLSVKTDNKAIMNLKKYMKLMLPYFAEEYGLAVC